jgi:hypothetical protein
VRKFFPRDKNYVLEQAQLSLKEPLIGYLTDFVKVEYMLRHNPLGLLDDTMLKIQSDKRSGVETLHEFYSGLAGVFRYKYYKDNQLEFLFDGRSDFEKYQEEWSIQYKQWIKEFCKQETFLRAILELTVFYPADYTPNMGGLRLSTFISKQFDLKIDPLRGIIARQA